MSTNVGSLSLGSAATGVALSCRLDVATAAFARWVVRYGPGSSYVTAISLTVLAVAYLVCTPLVGCSRTTEPCPARQMFAKVARALDGDTVLLDSGDKVRYIGVDAPETGECFAEEATVFHSELINRKEIRLEFDVRLVDPYGRLLAYVYLDTLFVNAALVREGCCRAAAFAPNTKHRELFEKLEAEAKQGERGMWGRCDPVGD